MYIRFAYVQGYLGISNSACFLFVHFVFSFITRFVSEKNSHVEATILGLKRSPKFTRE